MRTLLFTLEYPPFKGGVANYYSNLAKFWPINENLLILDNNKGELINPDKILAWWPAIFSLKRKLKASRIDYLLVGQILPLGTIACFWSFLRPLKYAVFLHGMDFSFALKTPWKRFLSYLILQRADKIISANSYVADKVKDFWPNFTNKITIINPGVESKAPIPDQEIINSLRKQYNLEGKFVIFSLGRLIGRKGFDRMISALAELPEDIMVNLEYFIAGTGSKEAYLHKLVPLKYLKKIHFLGLVSDIEKWSWFHLCDIFAMPARDIEGDYEGFGIVYLEANLCGKPVIAGSSGGIKDAVINNVTGLIVNTDNPNSLGELKEAILKLIADKKLRITLGAQGQKRAQEEFIWENQAQKVLDSIL